MFTNYTSALHFQGTWVQRNSSNLSTEDKRFLVHQLFEGPLDKKGVSYAVDATPDGEIIMIFDNNRIQKQAVESALKTKGLLPRFRYTHETLAPMNDISQKAKVLKARQAVKLWEEAIADKSHVDLEKLMQAMVLLKDVPGFKLMGVKFDPETGMPLAENVLDWLNGADPELVLRQMRTRWN